MIYKCKKCKRVIADIVNFKNMDLKGKSVEFTDDKIKIKCKCGEMKEIILKKAGN